MVKTWHPDRGFGFAHRPGQPDVFLHIKSFPRGASDPAVGDEVTFVAERQPDGRLRAADARVSGVKYNPPPRPMSPILGVFAILVFVAIYLLVQLFWNPVPLWVLFLYLGVSGLTFGVYAIDKSAAQRRQRRVPETSLILLGMFGGWPGAIVAQQLLRHKTAKVTFRAVFWVSVLINVVAFVALNAPQVVSSIANILSGTAP